MTSRRPPDRHFLGALPALPTRLPRFQGGGGAYPGKVILNVKQGRAGVSWDLCACRKRTMPASLRVWFSVPFYLINTEGFLMPRGGERTRVYWPK